MSKKQDVSKQFFRSTDLGKHFYKKILPKKNLNRKAASYIQSFLTRGGHERFSSCGDYLAHLTNEDMGVKKVHKANLCGNRFCPLCTWNKARKDAIMINVMMQAIKFEQTQEFIMLTLTTPNVSAEELKSEIDLFNKSFHKLFKRRNIQRIVKGYIRKLEVTYDNEPVITEELYKRKQVYFDKRELGVGDQNPQYDTYNPHFHILICVNCSYFTDTKSYISRGEWLEMWRDCTNDERITQVDVRKVRATEDAIGKAVLEVAKYSAKGNEIYYSKEVFGVFYKALKGRQLITFNGLFKEYVKKYKAGDLDKYKQQDENVYTHLLESFWRKSKYENILRELSLAEIEEYNKLAKVIDECEEID